MSHKETIATFASALDAIRAEYYALETEISSLQGERHRIEYLPPHTDDIIDTFRASLTHSTRVFKQQLGNHLRARYGAIGKHANQDAAQRSKSMVQVLTLEEKQPDLMNSLGTSPQPANTLNMAALTFLMSERIEALIPDLVRELYPEGESGIKKADRDAAIQAVDAKIDALRVKHSQLQEDIGAARLAVNGQR